MLYIDFHALHCEFNLIKKNQTKKQALKTYHHLPLKTSCTTEDYVG